MKSGTLTDPKKRVDAFKRFECNVLVFWQVHSKWGSEVGKAWHSYSRQDDLVALLSFESTSSSNISTLDEAVIRKVIEALSKKSGDTKLEPLRSSGLQLLMKFSSSAGYEALGKCFLDGKIEEISHLKLTEIQGMLFGIICKITTYDSFRYRMYDKGIIIIDSKEMVIMQAQSGWLRLAVNTFMV